MGNDSPCPRLRWTVSYSSSHSSSLEAVTNQSLVMGAVHGVLSTGTERWSVSLHACPQGVTTSGDDAATEISVVVDGRVGGTLVGWTVDKSIASTCPSSIAHSPTANFRVWPLHALATALPMVTMSTSDLNKLHFDQPVPGSPVSRGSTRLWLRIRPTCRPHLDIEW